MQTLSPTMDGMRHCDDSERHISTSAPDGTPIFIRHLGRGTDDWPKFAYQPCRRGQSQFILCACQDAGILASFLGPEIAIFSKRKVDKFLDIILKSFTFPENTLELTSETKCYYIDRTLLCLCIRSKDLTFVSEENFATVIRLQFEGRIAITKNYKILSTQTELRKTIETEGYIV